MGAEYLLASIAVVVIGGTSVAGGFANLPGLWGAAMLLFLLVTMLNTYGFGAGIRPDAYWCHHHRGYHHRQRPENPQSHANLLTRGHQSDSDLIEISLCEISCRA